MPKPEKLVKEGRLHEAAEAYREKALQQKDIHKRRRFLNFAGRYYESADEFSLAAKTFLESGDLDRTVQASIKSGNPKILSGVLIESGHSDEETVRLLLKCVVRLTEQREFDEAKVFAKEASDWKRSQLTDATINLTTAIVGMIDGILDANPSKLTTTISATRRPSLDDPLAREISFVASKFLANMPKIEHTRTDPPTECPECGAPLPHKRKGKVVECDYCGFPVRLE